MQPSLLARLTHYFDARVRSRGQQYYRTGEVHDLRQSKNAITAEVWGSQIYDVSLEVVDGVLTLDCGCPYFEGTGPCKHLWAVILAADARRYLSELDGAANIGFSPPETTHLEIVPATRPVPKVAPPASQPPPPTWRARLGQVSRQSKAAPHSEWPAKREILYIVETAPMLGDCLRVTLHSRDIKKDGTYGRPGPWSIAHGEIATVPQAEDRAILTALVGAESNPYTFTSSYSNDSSGRFLLRPPLSLTLFPEIVRTGRCYRERSPAPHDLEQIVWDEGGPWQFVLEMQLKPGQAGAVQVDGFLRRGQESLDVAAPALVTRSGFIVHKGNAARLEADTAFDWLFHVRQSGSIKAPAEDRDELLEALLCSPGIPTVLVPEDLRYEQVTMTPRPHLRIGATGTGPSAYTRLPLEVLFDYDGKLIPAADGSRGIFDSRSRRFLYRDQAAEQSALNQLRASGAKRLAPTYFDRDPGWDVASTKVPKLARDLVLAGWHVEAEGKAFRRPGAFRIQVSSGIDWFELTGGVQYGDTSAQLPELLAALRRGETMVQLGDGSYGMLPEDWLKRIGTLAGMGTPDGGMIRFQQNQAGLLDALLAAQPEAQFDETFARIRKELARFEGIEAAAQPDGFTGQLRDYQREGLGWMEFLRRYGVGGCLADDMGVGKTAQVLALLEKRRELRAAGELKKTSLAVVPRSLIFNWLQEAERFTPRLRVLDYTGVGRTDSDLASYDLVLTTYGTLRRDVTRLREVEFDYVVLDEAQTVKNGGSESAKAVRLIRGDHRLAMSGTPIENHLGELWSLFEFLNPGMLGAASVFKATGTARRSIDEGSRQLLAHALRPFILRRTKGQVARELPPKTEQTIFCELEPAQRKLYNELRRHYRESLLNRVQREGLGKSKIMVLEALLRLRQAACHPGLLDPKRLAEPSAKLDALLGELREVLETGHKALVFSQFTSLLAIVRDRLNAEGVVHEYLDGQTRNRQECVERFQNDADCGVFLVSLKAGGLGLNLTAAEYVFLLDPWWNPAVEAQAVDRTHRIGQTRPVFAYRLIARNTVEEKVLELQKSKRELAAAIIGEDNALIRDLKQEDLELLLS